MTASEGVKAIDYSSVVKISPDAFFSEVAEEFVILNLNTGTYHSFDEIGRQIWLALETPRSVDSVCASLVEEYPNDADAVRADTLEFVQGLAARGLIVVE